MVELRKDPPEIDPIAVKKPNITMLKLMVASDNSAEGMVFEGDLGTCMNLESLRKQRKPSGHLETSLASCFTLLGASHILWNVAQAIYLMHYGNPQDSNNLGAWQTLSSLGVPAEKPTTKKDFSLMITNLTKSHEASILYCLLTVMGYPHALLPDKKVTLPSQKLKDVVDKCYTRFFSPAAFDALDDDSDDSDASEDSQSSTGKTPATLDPQKTLRNQPPRVLALKNLLLRLRDFASIVECDRAMRAGDIGRVINMWNRWAVMANGMTGLRNYAIHLPRMVLLLTKVLPEGLATVLRHSLLVCPSGRPNHFVGKDFYLENQNFWLKYFYNHSGIGTEINRLKDVFSLNISIGLKGDSGKNLIIQSHKHELTTDSINNFLKMAQQHEILSDKTHKQIE
ncbi:hypothetical protein PSHT_16248 [Puccinia striiformis]|uniref:DUF6589 domain-containing protein n=1 Tax=Puccinia striiformis TaxID=27350 RepID=A0A2S4UAS2_9BASI|nr:hypothetical protein PSHT_16248 [Puccinia striiformis]